MASMHFTIDNRKDGKLFGVLLLVTSIYVTLLCFNELLVYYMIIFIALGIGIIFAFYYFFRILDATPTFLQYRTPTGQITKPKLEKRSFVILGFMAVRLFVALLVYFDVDFVFVAIGITIIDIINSKIVILTGKSVFWDELDNNLDIFSRAVAVFNYLFIYWWIPITIVLQYLIWAVRSIDIRYTWLRTFPPDVIWLVYAISYGGVAMFLVCIGIFILNLLSYSLVTGRNGVLLRPS